MVGGLMNLSSYGAENIILTGNPTKTMFKAVYHKYTNFGMQRFRLDYDGLRNLSFTQESTLKFTVKRYGDLIGDTYIVLIFLMYGAHFLQKMLEHQMLLLHMNLDG